ncbi:MAG: hypothetical protein AAGD05_02155 [Bacteroidota bacterium]
MQTKIQLLIGLFLGLMPLHSWGQYIVPDFQSQTIHNNELLIRWEPRTLEEWQNALQEGYQVKVYKGNSENNLALQSTETIQALSASEWDRAIDQQQDTLIRSFYEGAKSFLYMLPEVEEELKQSLEEEEGKTMQQTVDEFKLGYLVYAITYGYDLIRKAGLGYAVPLEKGSTYRIEVQTGNYTAYTFRHNDQARYGSSVPDLEAEFSDEKVTLKWETPAFKQYFYGYYLSISENGKRYTKVNEMPYINILDTLKGDPSYAFITEEVPLERNYKNYWLQLKGMNYFGIESRLASVEKGYGFEVIEVMPTIKHADQTKDNHADIRWTLDQKYNRLIDHFEIYRSDELDGGYQSVYTDIAASDRSVKVPMEHNRNYFSVAIVPKDGPVIRSFAVFIMGQDTIPPEVPQNFKGEIDSLGIVTLTWDQNTEEDLWGYKVFRSEYLNDEFGSLHASPIQDSFLVDTVNLHSINDQIHYTIIALDKRNNRSAFAPIISLERPDTIAPTAPLVRVVKFLEDSIKVTWAASSSDDVVLHQLFRREINEVGWELIAEQTEVSDINIYIDTLFQLNKTYVYTALARDDAQLDSPPSRPFSVNTQSKKPKVAFTRFDIDFDKESNTSTIRWDLQNENILEEIIVYRGPSREQISMYQIVEPGTSEIAQEVIGDEQWYFLFRPIFNDGSQAELSDIILVEKPQ